jgi:hypothetical protein
MLFICISCKKNAKNAKKFKSMLKNAQKVKHMQKNMQKYAEYTEYVKKCIKNGCDFEYAVSLLSGKISSPHMRPNLIGSILKSL